MKLGEGTGWLLPGYEAAKRRVFLERLDTIVDWRARSIQCPKGSSDKGHYVTYYNTVGRFDKACEKSLVGCAELLMNFGYQASFPPFAILRLD